MSKAELEKQARNLFNREVELDQKLSDATHDPAPEEIGEAAAELTADALLDQMRDTPSRERDVSLLRRAIDAVRAERRKVLRQIAEADGEIILRNVAVQRKLLAAREHRQQQHIRELLEMEELTLQTAGKLAAAIDPRTYLLHESKTERMRSMIDASERRARDTAARPIDAGECSGTDLDDLITRIVDHDEMYEGRLGFWTIAPTFESTREWFSEQEKAIRAGANLVGKVTYKLVWRNGEIVTRDKFNVVSGFSVQPPQYRETVSLPAEPPTKRVSEAGGLRGGHNVESMRV